MQAVETYNDRVVRQFTIATIFWGIVGMLVGIIIAAELLWPELFSGISWLSYGRLRPLHTNAALVAGSVGLVAEAVKLPARSRAVGTRAPLRNVLVAWRSPE